MLPDHSAAAFGFMLISTISPISFDDGLRTCPHSARPHRSMRTDPLLPSVRQSPSGVSAGASSTSFAILETWGAVAAAGRAASVGVWVGGVIDGIIGCVFGGWNLWGGGGGASRGRGG